MHLHGTAETSSDRSSTGWPGEWLRKDFRQDSCDPLEGALNPPDTSGRPSSRASSRETDGLFIAKFFSSGKTKGNPSKTWGDRAGCSIRNRSRPTAAHRRSRHARQRMPRRWQHLRRTFASYPFPIHRPEYISGNDGQRTIYFCARVKEKIAALAAAEIDPASQTCEMTDFATRPDYRRQGIG
jgi:hypothetical protein